MARLVQLPRYLTPVSNTHHVLPGQSIDQVAMIHNVSAMSIASHPANAHVIGGGPLVPGTRLHIPKTVPGSRLERG